MSGRDQQSVDPEAHYRRRLIDCQTELSRQSRIEFTVSVSRLASFVAIVVAAWLALQQRQFGLGWMFVPASVFLMLLVVHEKALRAKSKAGRAVDYFRAGLARLARDQSGDHPDSPGGDSGERYLSSTHLYAGDLDLFGRDSLYQRLSRARTRGGQDRLAGWLLDAGGDRIAQGDFVAELEQRQHAVAELAAMPKLLEELAVSGVEETASIETSELLSWAEAPSRFGKLLAPLSGALAALAIANLVALFGWWLLDWPVSVLLSSGVVTVLAHAALLKRWQSTIEGVERAQREVDLILGLLAVVEDRRFESKWLQERSRSIQHDNKSPSVAGAQLRQLVALADSRRNPFFVPIGLLVVFVPQIAVAVERWRLRWSREIFHWLEALSDLEALASLTTLAFECPANPFPELSTSDQPLLEGVALCHPLLPQSVAIANDVSLGTSDGRPSALVISGSNMSGKSTYLRTCGLNVVLALAGSVVCARSLRLTPLEVCASMRINDSLSEGSSKFYAEISRLRAILEATERGWPVLFLLDEILHGTNSHDRRIGAEGVLAALLEKGSIGFMTTHDLALAELADGNEEVLANMHFVDEVTGGKMAFDYLLRPGVVQRSNALALMRQVGLDV